MSVPPNPAPLRYVLYPDDPAKRPASAARLTTDDGVLRPAFNRSLSLALAMRGGVSLAVWIGGCVAEIDVVRRVRVWRDGDGGVHAYLLGDDALPDPQLPMVLARADHYARLLISRGYDRLEVDVLAGASAGGLNSVLYAVAQRAGVGVDGLLDLWSTSGAIWALLRESGGASVPSVLSGDFFWRAVVDAMTAFYGRTANPLHRTRELTVDLSATITDASFRSQPGSPEGRAHLHFVGTPVPSGSGPAAGSRERAWRVAPPNTTGRDIPSALTADSLMAVRRLGYAARTTSSFPGAFEQASIWSPTTIGDGRLPEDPKPRLTVEPAVDMTFAFSAHRPQRSPKEPQPIRTMDGGILDNIPIDRVYRAIKDRTSDTVGDRVVIYLDPNPDMPVQRRPPTVSDPPRFGVLRRLRPTKQSFIGTIMSGIFMRGIRESGASEVADLEAAVDLRREADGRAVAFARETAGRRRFDRDAARSAYISSRAATDSQLVEGVLGDPDLWQLTTDLATRHVWEPTDAGDLRLLSEAFQARYAPLAAPGVGATPGDIEAIRQGSQALRDATLCLTEWFGAIEDALTSGGPDDTDLERAYRDQLRLDIHGVGIAARRLRDSNVGKLLDTVRNPDDASPLDATRVATLWVRLEAATPTSEAWGKLDECLERVRGYATPAAWSAFPSAWTAIDLAPFAAPRGVPDPLRISQFSTITAAEPTGFTASFAPLLHAKQADAVSAWLTLSNSRFDEEATAAHLPTELDPNAKLAGSALGDFGAFFSRAWRTNDWWWGRLDAAAGMSRTVLSLLASPQGGAQALPEDAAATLAVDLQEQVLRQADAAPDGVRPYPTALGSDASGADVAARMSAGAHSLAQLRPAYLVSIASRAVRLVVRALRSGQSLPTKLAISLLMPPFLIVVPFLFAAIRAGFAITAAFAILQFIGSPSVARDAGGWIVFGIAALVWLAQGATTLTRWRRMNQLGLFGPDEPFLALRSRAIRARWRSGGLLALGAAALAIMLVRNLLGHSADSGLVYLLAVVIVTAFAAQLTSASLAASGWWSSTIAWGALTAVAASVVIVPEWWGGVLTGLGLVPGGAVATWLHHPAFLVGLTGAIAFAAVTFGWFGIDSSAGRSRAAGLAKWLAGAILVGLGSGGATWAVLALIVPPSAPGTTFSQGLAAGLVAWVVGAHVGWWWGELFRHRYPVVAADEPKF